MTKAADHVLSARIDRTVTGYHVVSILVCYSDMAIDRTERDGRADYGMTWGFAPIEFRSQSDRNGETSPLCYGHEEPTIGHHTRLREAENACRKARQLVKAIDKRNDEHGRPRTPGDVLARIASASRSKTV